MKHSNARQEARWSRERLLAEARGRTKALDPTDSDQVRNMLAALVAEAGWTDEEFLDVMIQDVIENGKQKPVTRSSGVRPRVNFVPVDEDDEKKRG